MWSTICLDRDKYHQEYYMAKILPGHNPEEFYFLSRQANQIEAEIKPFDSLGKKYVQYVKESL